MAVFDQRAWLFWASVHTADTLEVIEDRSGLRSTIITSQLPVAHWHEGLGDATLADALLDRLSQNLHRIEVKGDSMRQTSPKKERVRS